MELPFLDGGRKGSAGCFSDTSAKVKERTSWCVRYCEDPAVNVNAVAYQAEARRYHHCGRTRETYNDGEGQGWKVLRPSCRSGQSRVRTLRQLARIRWLNSTARTWFAEQETADTEVEKSLSQPRGKQISHVQRQYHDNGKGLIQACRILRGKGH